ITMAPATTPCAGVTPLSRTATRASGQIVTMLRRTAPDAGVESWFFTANDDSGGGTFQVIHSGSVGN
ncbi:hypothetical protein, partial [Nocardioides sp. NPDC006303]|uniref:hypothetical protein n=1 Tax=Nocardioides sp. NPDC006303 TaxID=3156747 RepID=UPI0033B87E02